VCVWSGRIALILLRCVWLECLEMQCTCKQSECVCVCVWNRSQLFSPQTSSLAEALQRRQVSDLTPLLIRSVCLQCVSSTLSLHSCVWQKLLSRATRTTSELLPLRALRYTHTLIIFIFRYQFISVQISHNSKHA